MKLPVSLIAGLIVTHAICIAWGYFSQSQNQAAKADSYRLNVAPSIVIGEHFAGLPRPLSEAQKRAAHQAHALIEDTLWSSALDANDKTRLANLEERLYSLVNDTVQASITLSQDASAGVPVSGMLVLENVTEMPLRLCVRCGRDVAAGPTGSKVFLAPDRWINKLPAGEALDDHIVSLGPGETHEFPIHFGTLQRGTATLIAQYRVEEPFGSQHNVWSGVINTRPTRVKVK